LVDECATNIAPAHVSLSSVGPCAFSAPANSTLHTGPLGVTGTSPDEVLREATSNDGLDG
jgi:hypothetical protein